MPAEMAVAAFERLTDPGGTVSPPGGLLRDRLAAAGKGIPVWGRELTPDTTRVKAGLTFTCKDGSAVGFRGADAVRRHQAGGVRRRLASFVIDRPGGLRLGRRAAAPRRRAGRFASSAAFGHTLGRAVLLGYLERRDGGTVDPQWLKEGRYQVAISGELFDAAMTLRAPYDPERTRVLA